jgi:hypothetical protein
MMNIIMRLEYNVLNVQRVGNSSALVPVGNYSFSHVSHAYSSNFKVIRQHLSNIGNLTDNKIFLNSMKITDGIFDLLIYFILSENIMCYMITYRQIITSWLINHVR